MNKVQLVLILSALVLIAAIYQLPRVVVENEQLQEVTSSSQPVQHEFQIPPEMVSKIRNAKDSLELAQDKNKKAKFALSLSRFYLDYGKLDSAVYYADLVSRWSSTLSRSLAELYYGAYERSTDHASRKIYAGKAEVLFRSLLENDPVNLYFKNRLAMVLTASQNPMLGVMMLREIIEVNPENRLALLNLGLLAIQSGQFEKAKERFKELTRLNPVDYESKLYLAVSLIETDSQDQAVIVLNEILSTSDSLPVIKVMAKEYLESIQPL